jgi:hypothetical protein
MVEYLRNNNNNLDDEKKEMDIFSELINSDERWEKMSKKIPDLELKNKLLNKIIKYMNEQDDTHKISILLKNFADERIKLKLILKESYNSVNEFIEIIGKNKKNSSKKIKKLLPVFFNNIIDFDIFINKYC